MDENDIVSSRKLVCCRTPRLTYHRWEGKLSAKRIRKSGQSHKRKARAAVRWSRLVRRPISLF